MIINKLMFYNGKFKMVALILLGGIICIILLVNNIVSILHKVRDRKETSKSTFICCITLIYLWVSTIFLSAS